MKAVLAVMYREYLIRMTSQLWLFFDMVVPLMYMLMFGVGLDRAIGLGIEFEGRSLSYNEFFLAGVLSMTCFGSAINQSYGFFIDRDNGIFYEFLTYPMTRGQLLIGKILFQCLMSIVQCTLTLAAAAWLLGVPLRVDLIPLVVAGVVIGVAAWFFFLAFFAFQIRRNDTFNTVINVAYFVLMFVSSLFYPLENAPGWLQTAALVNPMTWHTDALRYFTIGLGDPSVVLWEIIGFGIFLGASFWIAVKAVQRAA